MAKRSPLRAKLRAQFSVVLVAQRVAPDIRDVLAGVALYRHDELYRTVSVAGNTDYSHVGTGEVVTAREIIERLRAVCDTALHDIDSCERADIQSVLEKRAQ